MGIAITFGLTTRWLNGGGGGGGVRGGVSITKPHTAEDITA